MKLRSSLLFALLSATAAAFSPYVTLNVSPADILVTETAEATVEIFMPRPFRHNPSVTADFIPQDRRLSMTREQVSLGAGTNAWRYVLRVPIAGSSVGEHSSILMVPNLLVAPMTRIRVTNRIVRSSPPTTA